MKEIKSFQSQGKETFFEGWYLRQTFEDSSLNFSVIFGIHKEREKREAFIQLIHYTLGSFYFAYPYESFSYQKNPLYIQIEENYFSEKELVLNIQKEKIQIHINFMFSSWKDIKRTWYAPTIMGPFSYLKKLECYHEIVSLSHNVKGRYQINDLKYLDIQGRGYIEKDFGTSFPKSYLWCQCHTFENKNTNLFLSIATVPIGKLNIKGHIAILDFNQEEIRFATYLASKAKYQVQEDLIIAELTSSKYRLQVTLQPNHAYELIAPKNSAMNHKMKESIETNIKIALFQDGKLIYQDNALGAAMELVKAE